MKTTKTLSHGKEGGTDNILDLFGGPRDFLPAGYVTNEATRDAVMAAVCALPEEYLEALLLRYYMELDREKTAFVLDASPMRAAYILTKAEVMLKEYIEKVFDVELEYYPVPAGDKPMLTKLFLADTQTTIAPDMLERLRTCVRNALCGDTPEER